MSFHTWKLCLVLQVKYNGKVERALKKKDVGKRGERGVEENILTSKNAKCRHQPKPRLDLGGNVTVVAITIRLWIMTLLVLIMLVGGAIRGSSGIPARTLDPCPCQERAHGCFEAGPLPRGNCDGEAEECISPCVLVSDHVVVVHLCLDHFYQDVSAWHAIGGRVHL